MASTRSSFEIAHFDRAIKSLSALDQDFNVVTKTSHTWFSERTTFACLPTGYGVSFAVRVAAELSVVSKDLFPKNLWF